MRKGKIRETKIKGKEWLRKKENEKTRIIEKKIIMGRINKNIKER